MTRRLWTVAEEPSRVSHRCTIHRGCSRIFCTVSHTVGDNKLCGIYLIFHLDLNYIMGSQRQWAVFELLDCLSVVNMQLKVCRQKIGIIQGSFGNFYTLLPPSGFIGPFSKSATDCFSRALFDVRARCPQSPRLNACPLAAALGESLHASVEPGVRSN